MKISPTWKYGQSLMRSIMEERGKSDLEKLQAIMRTELFAVNSADQEERDLSIREWLRFAEPVGEEAECYPRELTSVINGRRVSCDFLKKSLTARLIGKCQRVLEVGAGFGQVARIMLQNEYCKHYVIIDLEETLWFSERFLRLTLPGKRIVRATTEKDLSATPDALLVPAQLAANFKQQVDCFVNTSSLGEMDNSAAKLYIDLVQSPQVGAKKIVLLNRLMNTYDPRVESNREHEAGWYFSLDSNWAVSEWTLEPEFTRIPFEQQMHHRELLFIAARTPTPVPPYVAPLPPHKQRWWAYRTSRASERRANQLGLDNSTARELFEAVRINPSGERVEMLLAYLHSFGKRFPFEEEHYLTALYAQLTGKRHPAAHGTLTRFVNDTTSSVARIAWKLRHKRT